MEENLNDFTKEEQYEKDSGGATLKDGEIIRIPAKSDFMFKNLFGVNGKEENLKGLLQAILKIEIESLEIQNPELPRNRRDAKLGILDVRAKLSDGTIASIEMQVENQNNIGERLAFYVCQLYINTIDMGQAYHTANKTIAIAIIDFSYFNRKEYHQIAHLKFDECKDKNEIVKESLEGKESEIVTDRLEVHIIDLKKFREMKNPKGELADWLNLILGNEGAIEMASKKNERIAKANEDNKKLSSDKEMQDLYWSEKMALYDENTRIGVAIQKGERKSKIEIAKKLLKKNMNIEEIEEVTGLSEEEIKKLNNHY